MPDLVTHIAISHLIKRPFEFGKTNSTTIPIRVLFYLGTILPDILTRPWYIIYPPTMEWTFPIHTPFGMLLISSLLALFFDCSIRKKAFVFLMAGASLHFLLDGMQRKLVYTEHWLYPFSWKAFGFHVMWAEDILFLIPVWLVMILLLEGLIWKVKKSRNTK